MTGAEWGGWGVGLALAIVISVMLDVHPLVAMLLGFLLSGAGMLLAGSL